MKALSLLFLTFALSGCITIKIIPSPVCLDATFDEPCEGVLMLGLKKDF